jgi:DNA modification methylase
MRANRLNNLDAKGWLKFTKSWFIHHPKKRSTKEKLHPAKYPESLVTDFILYFTKKGELVLDPFCGTGSTLVACDETDRKGIGIELLGKYAAIARSRTAQHVIVGDARDVQKHVKSKVDFVMTSPPYGPMLNKKGLAQKKRATEKLDTTYSNRAEDIGNISNYESFVDTLVEILKNVQGVLKKDGYLVIVIQNYREGGEYKPLAWDVGKKLSSTYTLVGERLWLQDNKTLFPYGMGYSYVPNVHHHYCLVLRNNRV